MEEEGEGEQALSAYFFFFALTLATLFLLPYPVACPPVDALILSFLEYTGVEWGVAGG